MEKEKKILFEAIDRALEGIPAGKRDPETLAGILSGFDFNIRTFEKDLLYPEEFPYGRSQLYTSVNFEAVLMNWKPGRGSNIHDHGQSFGCVVSLSGVTLNVNFDQNLEYIGTTPLRGQQIAMVPKGVYHRILNPGKDYAVSLHFYSPPIEGMKVVDESDASRTYIVKNNNGAWNPAPGQIDNIVNTFDENTMH